MMSVCTLTPCIISPASPPIPHLAWASFSSSLTLMDGLEDRPGEYDNLLRLGSLAPHYRYVWPWISAWDVKQPKTTNPPLHQVCYYLFGDREYQFPVPCHL